MAPRPFHERVFAVVRRIPRGRVASYKLVAQLAGSPGGARQVGRVMRLARGTPWHRVIAADGRIVTGPVVRREQIELLVEEGIDVSPEGTVDMARHLWKPRR